MKKNVNNQKKSPFQTDFRKTNPNLHMFYVKQAVLHLREIDRAIRSLDRLSNLNMSDVIQAMLTERKRLVEENAAYADAQEIIQIYREGQKAPIPE